MPAPPPESLPAIVSTRGRGELPRTRSAGKVVPPLRRERRLLPIVPENDEIDTAPDLAQLTERNAERVPELRRGRSDGGGGHRGEQLVVLASAQSLVLRRSLGDGHVGEAKHRAHARGRGEPREVEREPVRHVD